MVWMLLRDVKGLCVWREDLLTAAHSDDCTAVNRKTATVWLSIDIKASHGCTVKVFTV